MTATFSITGLGSPVPDATAQVPLDSLRTASLEEVELHYVETGDGEPIVFVHGGLVDYREWSGVMAALPSTYRLIAYSRRYNYPNLNDIDSSNHSARVEARDLAELIEELDAAPANVAGISYGALTALILALERPDLVRTLILVEPPILPWLPALPGGEELRADFMSTIWQPAGAAFRSNDTEEALRVTVDGFFGQQGAYETLPPEFVESLHQNAREWEALTTSSQPFPEVDREAVSRLAMPVLMLGGAQTMELLKRTDAELERLLSGETRVVVPEATHDVCTERPATCAEAIHAFLDKNEHAGGHPQ